MEMSDPAPSARPSPDGSGTDAAVAERPPRQTGGYGELTAKVRALGLLRPRPGPTSAPSPSCSRRWPP